MKELINIKNENGKQLVSARELYDGLGLQRTNRNNWVKINITSNEFFIEGVDWTGCMINIQGNNCMEYIITLNFAKHLCMMAKTEKSHEYRNYFIECENQLLLIQPSYQIVNPIDRAKRWIVEEEERQTQLLQLEEQKPKVEAFNKFIDSDGLYSYTNASKLLGLQVRKQVMPYLRNKGLIVKDNLGSTSAIQRGLIKNVITNGGVYQQGKFTPRGVEYLRKNFK